MPRAAAAVVLALVGPVEGAGAFTPLPVVAALMPVLLGGLRVLPGLALGARPRLFPLVAVSVGALQLLPAVLGLQVRGGAVVVVAPGAAAVAAGPAPRPGAVGTRQAPTVVVAARQVGRS